MRKTSLTAAQFAAAAVIADLSPARTKVAYSVLVEGMTYRAATEPYGHSRQSGRAPVLLLLRAHDKLVKARLAEVLAEGRAAPASLADARQLLEKRNAASPRRRKAPASAVASTDHPF
ncbi:hypothetical protein [Variovorax paradoxus]|uniref:hypothetical protein n=1 Tax=Variovorax paradoxus TaxID=34073 RepID=UPI001ABCF77F